jgi:hypothetical protein
MELVCNSHFDPDGEDDIDYSARPLLVSLYA